MLRQVAAVYKNSGATRPAAPATNSLVCGEIRFAWFLASLAHSITIAALACGGTMSSLQRLEEIRTGFERPFWVANISEIFERLSYYGAFASLALYLQEKLNFSTEQTGTLTGLFGGMVWFLAIFGGAVADKLGFRRALSLAYLILAAAYFLIGSIGASWLAPIRSAVPLTLFVGCILLLPALGIALVKPSVVGTTARASKENVRTLGYSIYYTMVNIGGTAGPFVADWAHRHFGVERVFRISALSVFAMFFLVFFFFRDPRKPGDEPPPSVLQVIRNFCVVLGNYWLVLPTVVIALILAVTSFLYNFSAPWWVWVGLLLLVLAGISRVMWFLVIFTGYWIVFWQQYTSLPGYIHTYVNLDARVELILITDAAVVVCLTFLVNFLARKIPPFHAVILGTVISSASWLVLSFWPTVTGAVVSIAVLALGEIIQQPPYYAYSSRLAPPGQQGTYMGFAFLPIGIGSLVGGWFGGTMMHHFGEVAHHPERAWWAISGVGFLTALLLLIYDRIFKPSAHETPL
jgi:POT family proton-dependent oligopeptide transporter